MDLITALRALRRRWVLTATLLVLSLASITFVTFKLPWTYQAQSTVVLLPSHNVSALNGYNPYLSFGPSITNAAFLISVKVMSPPYQQKLTAAGDTGLYTVTLSPDTDGPVLVTTVLGHNRAVTERTLVAVTNVIGAVLKQTQISEGITQKKSMMTLQVESMTAEPTLLISKKAKTIGMIAALALILTIGVPLLVDAHAKRRALEEHSSLNGHTSRPQVQERSLIVPNSPPYRPGQGSPRKLPGNQTTSVAGGQERQPGR
jgi:hypothetical protein